MQVISLDTRCKACFERSYKHLFEKFAVNPEQQKDFYTYFEEVFRTYKTLSAPEIQTKLNAEFTKLIGTNDPFEQEKKEGNRMALELYKEWKTKVFQSENPFELALRLSVAGNIMDYGVANQFDVHKTIDNVLNANFAINHIKHLHHEISKANKILYLGDNTGEIVFDKLFLEVINHPRVVFAVKDAAILNDATFEDANYVEIDKVAHVISNGDTAPSTLLNRVSQEFLNHYQTADLIISKGQGNLEGLIGEQDDRIYFLLMAKCDVIADVLKVNKGSFIVYNQKHI